MPDSVSLSARSIVACLRVAAWQQGQRLITDPAADLEVVAAIRAQGVEVVISA